MEIGTGVNGPSLKLEGEHGSYPESAIKLEHELSNEIQMDDDIYEDAGDLEFETFPPRAFLMRLPKILYKDLTSMDDDDEIEIGVLREEFDGQTVKRRSLMLDQKLAQQKLVPREYIISESNSDPMNTFVFTECDLQGYSKGGKAGSRQKREDSSAPSGPLKPQFQSRSFNGVEKGRRQPFYRRAIPKKTSLIAKIDKEFNCIPAENQDKVRVMDERAKRDYKAPLKAERFTGNTAGFGGTSLGPNFSDFVKTQVPSKSKQQEQKALRMPRNELMDLLLKCFNDYAYWGFKELKQRVNQPEAYLKETLEPIAQIVRQGTFTNKWMLKQEIRQANNLDGTNEAMAPEVEGEGEIDDGSDDEDAEQWTTVM
ncbi:hypothetical protein MMC25_006542 [Agyrium rufum]|nr:hypothetical protein [Agyrium rufum]